MIFTKIFILLFLLYLFLYYLERDKKFLTTSILSFIVSVLWYLIINYTLKMI